MNFTEATFAVGLPPILNWNVQEGARQDCAHERIPLLELPFARTAAKGKTPDASVVSDAFRACFASSRPYSVDLVVTDPSLRLSPLPVPGTNPPHSAYTTNCSNHPLLSPELCVHCAWSLICVRFLVCGVSLLSLPGRKLLESLLRTSYRRVIIIAAAGPPRVLEPANGARNALGGEIRVLEGRTRLGTDQLDGGRPTLAAPDITTTRSAQLSASPVLEKGNRPSMTWGGHSGGRRPMAPRRAFQCQASAGRRRADAHCPEQPRPGSCLLDPFLCGSGAWPSSKRAHSRPVPARRHRPRLSRIRPAGRPDGRDPSVARSAEIVEDPSNPTSDSKPW